jgi:NADH-ubiquinone oxidoreductase chain 2
MLILLVTLLLVSNAVTLKREKSIMYSRIAIAGVTSCGILVYYNLHVTELSSGIGLFGGLFNVTGFTQGFNLFIFVVGSLILTLTAFLPRKVSITDYSSLYDMTFNILSFNKNIISNRTEETFRIIEYALVALFVLCGAVFLMSTGDLISIFLSIELQSYGLYILCALYRDSESSTASALTYFLLGGLSSCFILLGSALLYANSGTTNLDNIYIITSISDAQVKTIEHSGDSLNILNTLYLYQPYFFHISLIIMSVGFLFKVSAAPFHF